MAAIAKMLTSSFPVRSPITDLIPDWAADLLVVGELLFGIHLVLGQFRYATWLLTLVLMSVFLLHALSLTLSRSSSCGCMGAVKIPPILTLLFDLFMIAVFLRCRPERDGWPILNPAQSPVAKAFWVMAVLLLVAGGVVVAKYGSVGNALDVMNGRNVIANPSRIKLFGVDTDRDYEVSVNVSNFGSEPVEIHLFYSRCNCATATNLPLTVEPGRSAPVTVLFHSPSQPTSFQRECLLSTSAGNVSFEIEGFTNRTKSPTED